MTTKFEKQRNYKELSQNEIESVSGGDWFSSGFTGASIGGAVGTFAGDGAAIMAGVRGARWGSIAGGAGAAVGFGVGVAYYYFAH